MLTRVDRDGAFAGRVLSAALDRAGDIEPAERALATELVYGVLRRAPRIDRALAALARKGLADVPPLARTALRVGAYQLLFLDRVPAYAAVNDAVERCKREAGAGVGRFANAILRRVSRQGEPPLPDPTVDPLAWMTQAASLPEWLGRLALTELGRERALAFADAGQRPAPLALRANTLRAGREASEARLAVERPIAVITRSAVAPEALLAHGLDALAETSCWRDGLLAVEDVGAQVATALCGSAPGERILDACAGVGGKSAHLAALSGDRATIVAADISAKKLAEAGSSLRRLGVGGVRIAVCDLTAADGDPVGPFERVLLDAPCSGLGVLRRHPEVAQRRTPADLATLAARQRRLLDGVASRVRPGGLLVYSVCTFDRAECEDVIHAFLASRPDFVVEPPQDPILRALADAAGFVRTWPQEHDADAFFVARLRRAQGPG